MSEDLSNIITLNDEDGNGVDFEFLDLIEYDSAEYVVLLPVDDEDDSGEVVILRVDPVSEDEESYVSCDDDEVAAVFEIFKEKFKDTFHFE